MLLQASVVSGVLPTVSGGGLLAEQAEQRRVQALRVPGTTSSSALWGERRSLVSSALWGKRCAGASFTTRARQPRVQTLRGPMAAVGTKIDLEGNVTLQKGRTWDEGSDGGFTTTPLSEIFKGQKVVIFGLPGAFTGVCTKAHVPSYIKLADEFKQKGVDKIVCVSVNDPYTMNAWADKLDAKTKLEFYGDFDGSFHKSLGLDLDMTFALLGPRSQRWSAYVVDGKIEALNVEDSPSDFKVSDAETILKSVK